MGTSIAAVVARLRHTFTLHWSSKGRAGESHLRVWRARTNRYCGKSPILRWVNHRVVGVQVQRQLGLRLLQLCSRVRRRHLRFALKIN